MLTTVQCHRQGFQELYNNIIYLLYKTKKHTPDTHKTERQCISESIYKYGLKNVFKTLSVFKNSKSENFNKCIDIE